MKIGINLVGVSYNDGAHGRYRNYEDAIDGFITNVINHPQFYNGYNMVKKYPRSVSILGSAILSPENEWYKKADT